MRKKVFYIIWFVVVVFLIILSLSYHDRSQAIVAQVESQKTAISFQKPVRIKKIHVVPGQEIKIGQLLLEIERPDLVLDMDKLINQKNAVISKQSKSIQDFNSRIRLLEIETANKITRLDAEAEELTARMEINNLNYSRIAALVDVDSSDSDMTMEENLLLRIRINSLNKEVLLLQNHFTSEKERWKILLDRDLEIISGNLLLLDKEIEVLKEEERSLIQRATFDGTIGNVSVQLLELIPPYETIISIYESHPTLIKAYMNETNQYEVQVGNKVIVESTNREYQIDGEIVEIGSRFVAYPDQIRIPNQPDIWGQEIFIKISPDNRFLNGEKVFVNIN